VIIFGSVFIQKNNQTEIKKKSKPVKLTGFYSCWLGFFMFGLVFLVLARFFAGLAWFFWFGFGSV
jgi:hypothetical protein